LTGPVDRTIPHFAAALIHNITILRLGKGCFWGVCWLVDRFWIFWSGLMGTFASHLLVYRIETEWYRNVNCCPVRSSGFDVMSLMSCTCVVNQRWDFFAIWVSSCIESSATQKMCRKQLNIRNVASSPMQVGICIQRVSWNRSRVMPKLEIKAGRCDDHFVTVRAFNSSAPT
jgi:hypothetical protein